jgi:hypothetical protein
VPRPEEYTASEAHSVARSVLPRSNPSIRINFERRTNKSQSQSDHSHFHSSEGSHIGATSPTSPISATFPSSPQYPYLPSSSSRAVDAGSTLAEEPALPSRSGSPTSFRDLPLGGLSPLSRDAHAMRWRLTVTNATPTCSLAEEGRTGYFVLAQDSTLSFGESTPSTPSTPGTPRNPFSDSNAVLTFTEADHSQGHLHMEVPGSPLSISGEGGSETSTPPFASTPTIESVSAVDRHGLGG